MFHVDILGAGNGRPGAARDTAGLLIVGGDARVLVDCPGGVVAKLAARGLMPEAVDAVLLTHDHVDHIYGLPHLLHALAIAGTRTPVRVYAPADTLVTVRAVLAAYGLDGPKYPGIEGMAVDPAAHADLEVGGLRMRAAWAQHSRPTLATRWQYRGTTFASTSDTVGTSNLDELIGGVDLLLHDCGGLHQDLEDYGAHHASALQAGEAAARARVGKLALMHLPPLGEGGEAALRSEAAAVFGGEVVVATDGDRFLLDA